MGKVLVFAGHCARCDRPVGNTFRYESAFLETPDVRIACAECGHPTLCEKET